MLETIENRFPGRDYLVELGAPEFTSICPLTDAPDFGELTIRYVPDGKLYELKSLRDFLTSFRERKIFQEEVVNEVLEQLVADGAPRFVEVEGEYGIDGLYIGVPVKLGAGGIEEIVELDLSDDEREALGNSAEAVREVVGVLST